MCIEKVRVELQRFAAQIFRDLWFYNHYKHRALDCGGLSFEIRMMIPGHLIPFVPPALVCGRASLYTWPTHSKIQQVAWHPVSVATGGSKNQYEGNDRASAIVRIRRLEIGLSPLQNPMQLYTYFAPPKKAKAIYRFCNPLLGFFNDQYSYVILCGFVSTY